MLMFLPVGFIKGSRTVRFSEVSLNHPGRRASGISEAPPACRLHPGPGDEQQAKQTEVPTLLELVGGSGGGFVT